MKITRQRNSRKQNNTVLTEKTFTMTETGLTPEQEMDILFGKIMSGFFEVWESGPRDFTVNFHLDPLYLECMNRTGRDKFTDKLQAVIDIVLEDLTIWNLKPLRENDVLINSISFMEDLNDEHPLTITISIHQEKE